MKKTGVVILCVIVMIVWIFDGIASGVVNALLSSLRQLMNEWL